MNKKLIEELKIRCEKAMDSYRQYQPMLFEAIKYSAPSVNAASIYDGFDGVQIPSVDVVDMTAEMASCHRANRMHSLLIPFNQTWGSVKDYDPKTNQENNNDQITQLLFNGINRSNLHEVAQAFFIDLNIGTGALWVDYPKGGPPIFKNLPGYALMPEYSDVPNSVNVWYKRKLSQSDVMEMRPGVVAEFGDKKSFIVTYGYIDVTEDDRFDGNFLHIAFLDDDKWQKPLMVEVRDYKQLILVNDIVLPGESRGRGIILKLLTEIKKINYKKQKIDRDFSYISNPAKQVPTASIVEQMDDVNAELEGTVLVGSTYDDSGKTALITPVLWDMQLEIRYKLYREDCTRLEKFFNVNPYGELNESPAMSATEVGVRQEEDQRQTVADVSKIQAQLNKQIMECLYGMYKADNLIKKSTAEPIFRFDSFQADIQAQRDITSLINLAQTLNQIQGEGAASTWIKQEEVTRFLFNKFKMSKTLMQDPEQVKMIQSQMAQQMSQQQPANPISGQDIQQQSQDFGLGS